MFIEERQVNGATVRLLSKLFDSFPPFLISLCSMNVGYKNYQANSSW
jgi:hypothetical protein